jgi:hypothetical protein
MRVLADQAVMWLAALALMGGLYWLAHVSEHAAALVAVAKGG